MILDMLVVGVPLAAMPRNDGPSPISKNEADDHAYHKLHFFILCGQKKGPGDGDQPGP
jgi:hypothetical protein